jgi:hypothetical protein
MPSSAGERQRHVSAGGHIMIAVENPEVDCVLKEKGFKEE